MTYFLPTPDFREDDHAMALAITSAKNALHDGESYDMQIACAVRKYVTSVAKHAAIAKRDAVTAQQNRVPTNPATLEAIGKPV